MTDRVISTDVASPEAAPVLEGLVREYDARYGDLTDRRSSRAEIERYPALAFSPPHGDFLVIRRDDQTIAGGALMPHDDATAEVKRVWTDPALRRQGLSRLIMQQLEQRAAGLGYTRLYLTTGFRQPEAVRLYLALGYRPLFDPAADPVLYRSLPFEKHIGAKAGQPGTAPLRTLAATPELAAAGAKAAKARHDAWLAARLGLATSAAG